MTAHTPGPWKDEITDDGLLVVRFPHAGNSTIDVCLGDMENTTGEDHANVRLIAAAPDLLKALGEAVDVLDVIVRAKLNKESPTMPLRSVKEAAENGMAALNKARGQS